MQQDRNDDGEEIQIPVTDEDKVDLREFILKVNIQCVSIHYIIKQLCFKIGLSITNKFGLKLHIVICFNSAISIALID